MNLRNETGQEIILENGRIIQEVGDRGNDCNINEIKLVRIENDTYKYIENPEDNIIGVVYISFNENGELILSNGDVILGRYNKVTNPL